MIKRLSQSIIYESHEGTKRLKAFLVVKWGVHTFNQIPLHAAPGALIGSCSTRPRWHDLSLDRPRPPGTWPLSSTLAVVIVVKQGVRVDLRGQDRWPFLFDPQGLVSQLQGKLSVWKSACLSMYRVIYDEEKCVWLKCSGAGINCSL